MPIHFDLSYRIFEDLKKIALRSNDFDTACKTLAITLRGTVEKKVMTQVYNESVERGDLLPIEIIPLQEKNDLKEMAKKYCNTVEYCKSLHLFIHYMGKEI